ncbi:cadherin-86C-like, partial [Centruroides vittatus]|uniref:cadherin-86C-like n=1 Tax=Centruroides vittatus TaxID=120091 RepID=UPI003510AFA3
NYINKAVQIEVIKVNKYKPYFLQYNDTINLEEEKIHGDVLSILAKDDDKKDFIKCYFENRDKLDSKFSLKQTVLIEDERPVNNVTLKNIEKLDYESGTFYRIVIIVKDNQHEEHDEKLEGTEFSNKAIIFINVVDIDDQNPTFIKDCGVQRISEHYKGTVAVVHAIDGDRGINNPIQYSIDENLQSSYFGMRKNGENGILFVKTDIDRKNEAITNNPILTVNIIAEEYYENGTRAVNRTTISACTIIVLDINDNKPLFNEKHYEASVKENTQIGIPITLNNDLIPKVSDIDEGKNAKFKLYLEDHEDIFAITSTQGINDVIFMIRVNKSEELDYEREDLLEPKQFNFKIIAKETETEERFYSVVNVTVNLEDVNDNFPQFSSDNVAYVYENASKGDFAASIIATDIDSGYYGTKDIRYRLITNYISDSFQIDSKTGDLRVSKDDHGFDYEKIQDYYLTIEARDENGTGNANTTQLHIVILDVNDNAPKFCYENYSGYLMENSEKFTDILQVQATDADEPNSTNSIIRYQIIHDAFEQFTIDPVEGIITPNSSLDFEDDEPPVNNNCITICTKMYFLKVMAYDLGIPRQSSEVSVYITLMRHTTEKNINKTFWEEQESYILVATIGTLIFCMLLLLIVYYIRISSYKRLLKAATAKAYTDANDYNMTKENTTIVPNTNLHAMQVSNPIWNQDEIVNKCFSEEAESDNGSQNSLDINDVEPNLCNNGGKDNPIFIPDNENGEVKSYNSQQMDSLNVCDEGYKGSEKTINLNKMDLLKAVDNNWRRKNSKNDFNTNLASAPSFQDGDLY